MKKTVALIFGGKSAEHEVSLRSAKNISDALDLNKFNPVLIGISTDGTWYKFADSSVFSKITKISDSAIIPDAEPVVFMCDKGTPTLYSLRDNSKTKIDCAFPIMHGTMGEDGAIQGLFRMIQVPFVGCDVWASAAGMDKSVMKHLLADANIASAKYMLLTPYKNTSYSEIVANLGSPFFIKPANAGSSVGVHKIKSEEDFNLKIKDSFQFDWKVLAEEFIQGREIECSVMGHNHAPKASLPGEVIAQHEFYSYEAKYLDENGALIKVPADIPKDTIERIQRMAEATYQVLGCDGLTRVDFFLRPNGELYINEINTIPGFTKISMYPKMWEASGLSYQELITNLFNLAFEKYNRDSALKTSFL